VEGKAQVMGVELVSVLVFEMVLALAEKWDLALVMVLVQETV